MIMVFKVEHRENGNFLGVEPAFFGAGLVVKTSSWPIQYVYRNEALILLFKSM